MILRTFQLHALEALRALKIDLVCVSPTGSGKGVILEVFATDTNERVLLISPLIALGRQQEQRFTQVGVNAICSMGLVTGEVSERAPHKDTRVWILSPEAAQNPRNAEKIRRWNPTLVAVDECHCIYEWGDDFRPAYGNLPKWVKDQGYEKTLWMSATLPREARTSIETGLGRKTILQGGFSLPEFLELRVERTPWPNRADRLIRHLVRNPSSGIIFTGTRAGTERIERLVDALDRPALKYHAGLSSEERRAIEIRVPESKNGVVIATSAFGMGMDYRSLKWVLLWQPTSTLLSLAQALGRVGRDGTSGTATLFWDEEDFRILGYLAAGNAERKRRLIEVRQFLEAPIGAHRESLAAFFR